MRSAVLDAALAYAARGWPVFPCQPGRKTPATARGFLDASTDPEVIDGWFARNPSRNVAIATGAPGPDVLDIDQHGPAGNGYDHLARLRRAGLLHGAIAWITTPHGGLHAYYVGTSQRSGRLPARHLDFRAAGGYVLAPPSRIGGRPYQLLAAPGGTAALDWTAVARLLQPRQPAPTGGRQQAAATDITRLAAWVGRLQPGNRNAGLYWAANRALDAVPDADLTSLADAARQVGLPAREITRTLRSARAVTRTASASQPDRQAEAAT
jgi:hypothetical protein